MSNSSAKAGREDVNSLNQFQLPAPRSQWGADVNVRRFLRLKRFADVLNIVPDRVLAKAALFVLPSLSDVALARILLTAASHTHVGNFLTRIRTLCHDQLGRGSLPDVDIDYIGNGEYEAACASWAGRGPTPVKAINQLRIQIDRSIEAGLDAALAAAMAYEDALGRRNERLVLSLRGRRKIGYK
jgi:hypothetical protein